MWGDESEAVTPIIWLFQIVDAQKEEVFFPELLITVQSYGTPTTPTLLPTVAMQLSQLSLEYAQVWLSHPSLEYAPTPAPLYQLWLHGYLT